MLYLFLPGIGLCWIDFKRKKTISLTFSEPSAPVSPLLEVANMHFRAPTSPIGQGFALSWGEQPTEDYVIPCYTSRIMRKRRNIAYRVFSFDHGGRIWHGLVFLVLLTSSVYPPFHTCMHTGLPWRVFLSGFPILRCHHGRQPTPESEALVGFCLLSTSFLSLSILDHNRGSWEYLPPRAVVKIK